MTIVNMVGGSAGEEVDILGYGFRTSEESSSLMTASRYSNSPYGVTARGIFDEPLVFSYSGTVGGIFSRLQASGEWEQAHVIESTRTVRMGVERDGSFYIITQDDEGTYVEGDASFQISATNSSITPSCIAWHPNGFLIGIDRTILEVNLDTNSALVRDTITRDYLKGVAFVDDEIWTLEVDMGSGGRYHTYLVKGTQGTITLDTPVSSSNAYMICDKAGRVIVVDDSDLFDSNGNDIPYALMSHTGYLMFGTSSGGYITRYCTGALGKAICPISSPSGIRPSSYSPMLFRTDSTGNYYIILKQGSDIAGNVKDGMAYI